MSALKAKSIFDIEQDDAREARLDAEAEADIQTGRVVSHAKVVAWLETWGEADELPCPTVKTV